MYTNNVYCILYNIYQCIIDYYYLYRNLRTLLLQGNQITHLPIELGIISVLSHLLRNTHTIHYTVYSTQYTLHSACYGVIIPRVIL